MREKIGYGKMLAVVLAFMLVLSFGGASFASDAPEIDAAGVKAMMEEGNVRVIFPLSMIEFNHLHITGSEHMGLGSIPAALPADKDAPLIFYCLGPTCLAAPRAARQAVEAGYKNVHTFRAGLPGWIQAGYPVSSTERLPDVDIPPVTAQEFKSMLDGGVDLISLDIRIQSQRDQYYIDDPRDVYLPFNNLHERVGELPTDKKIVIIDVGGQRAAPAGRFLVGRGFENVVFLAGGIQAWAQAGMPIKRGN